MVGNRRSAGTIQGGAVRSGSIGTGACLGGVQGNVHVEVITNGIAVTADPDALRDSGNIAQATADGEVALPGLGLCRFSAAGAGALGYDGDGRLKLLVHRQVDAGVK